MATLSLDYEYPVLFSDNAGRIQYSLSDSEVIYVVISNKEYLVPVAESAGYLELSDILRAAPVPKPGTVHCSSMQALAIITAGDADRSISTGRATVFIRVLQGGIYGKTASEAFVLTQKNWLTLSKGSATAPRPTAQWGHEPVCFMPYQDDVGGIVTAEVYLKNVSGQPEVTILDYGGVGWDDYTIITVDAGFSVIYKALEAARFPLLDKDGLIKWRVKFKGGNYGESYESQSAWFGVIPTKSNYREFIYRNSLGCWDSVYSKGDFKVTPKYTFASFLNRNTEGQLDSQAVETMEVSSGPLDGYREQRMWLEMLSSEEVYLVDQSGDMRLVVIEDSSPTLSQKDLNSLTFKCHYADRTVGNGTSISIEE